MPITGKDIRGAAADSLDYITNLLVQKRINEQKLNQAQTAAAQKNDSQQAKKEAELRLAGQKSAISAATTLARGGDPQATAGMHRFLKESDVPGFSGITPANPADIQAYNRAKDFVKVGLQNENPDFAGSMLKDAGLPYDNLQMPQSKKALADQRGAQEKLANTRAAELKRWNDFRIKSARDKADAARKGLLGNDPFDKKVNQFLKETTTSIRALENLIDPNTGTVPQRIRDEFGDVRPNPVYEQITADIAALTESIDKVRSYSSGRNQVVQDANKQDDTIKGVREYMDANYSNYTDAHVKAVMESPEMMKAVQAWRIQQQIANEPQAR